MNQPCWLYWFHLQFIQDDGVSINVLNLPGCESCGATKAEALENVQGALEGLITSYIETGTQIPWQHDAPPIGNSRWVILNVPECDGMSAFDDFNATLIDDDDYAWEAACDAAWHLTDQIANILGQERVRGVLQVLPGYDYDILVQRLSTVLGPSFLPQLYLAEAHYR